MLNFKSPEINRTNNDPNNKDLVISLKVQRVLTSRLREHDFINHPYSNMDVECDLEYVAKQKALHKQRETPQSRELKRIADIFEALVLWNSEQADWLGSKATTIKTSEYDDYKNGVDMVVEFQEERSASYLGLAADVTFSSDRSVIAKKFSILRDQIKRGTLAQVKYFHSDHTHFDGQLSKLPEVVIGVSKSMVLELARLWADGKNSTLANHRVGVLILKQMEMQLFVFAKYAQSIGQTEVARIYFDRLKLIQEILKEKRDLVTRVEASPTTDPVHLEIMKFMENWNRY